MRRRVIALTLALAGCAALPDESLLPEPVEESWWQGTWLVDAERLAPPSPTAAALVGGLADAVRYELTATRLRRVVAGEITDHPLALRRAGADEAELAVIDGRTLVIRRVDDGAVLVDGRVEHPLRRPAE